jgi:acetyl-CoA acetyltransferase
MTRVAILGCACVVAQDDARTSDAERLGPVIDEALTEAGLDRSSVGVVCTASFEFAGGVVGSMMDVFDVLACWPPATHTHLEGDGAFALHEAWIRLLAGEAEVALVCAYSRPLAADLDSVLGYQLDPYLVTPLGPGARDIAALQARALIEAGRFTEREFAGVVAARRDNRSIEEVLSEPYVASPLRESDCSMTNCSGVAAVVLAVDGSATAAVERPAWITGIDQRVESGALGSRDPLRSPSIEIAARRLGLTDQALDVLEVHAPYSFQELLVVDAIAARGIGALNPSGGVLPGDPMGVAGLIRIAAAARTVLQGDADSAAGHATNGPWLQHNLLCALTSGR